MVAKATGPRHIVVFVRGHDQMNSLEIGVRFFIENQNVTWEGKEPMTLPGHRVS